MKVNSTGLGKTTLVVNATGFELTASDKNFRIANQADEGKYIVLGMEAVEPVHWRIQVCLGGQDLRRLVGLALRPRVIIRSIWLLIRGNELSR
jgi:hypothetical protein